MFKKIIYIIILINNLKYINSFNINNVHVLRTQKKYINIKNNIEKNFNKTLYSSFEQYINIKKLTSEFYKQKDKMFNDENYKKNNSIIKKQSNIKLLTAAHANDYSRQWIVDMNKNPNNYEKFMYENMYNMIDFVKFNRSEFYYYIGYYDENILFNYEPYYIGVFELLPKEKKFDTYIILKNPNLLEKNNRNILEFKHELLNLCYDSNIELKFNNLYNYNKRYYLSWFV